ncbi:hypothetical protein [Maribacter aurantiacus]|uniref:Uncharacterized protein n=1 Tax=Maribacter aurantiacus TaxID=1882343 RepID=A0A5R8MD56_9FLAO|nr:hypothetical protein [Maribacter aurantiacus]TLF46689.1 hypothetical protein FEK29_02615 [Maribacter aurantiacus]
MKKRRTFKDIRAEYENLSSKTELKFKELTPFQQQVIKNRIRNQAKKDTLYNLKVTIISILIILSIIVFLYVKFMI